MPKRTDIKSILIIGAGPIVIGQACEFDYSGAQACKALREEGYRVILVNSNPATIMTDPDMADAHLHRADQVADVAEIIEKERPDALLPTMGGQTALNCALDLATRRRAGKVRRRDDRRLADAIDKAEDRERFEQGDARTSASTRRAPGSPTAWKRPAAFSSSSASRASSVRPSPWAAPVAASPTTVKSS